MGMWYEAALVFGYAIEDNDYPYPDWDDEASIEKYENWKDDYNDNDYRILFSYHWPEPNEIFGILLGTCDCGEIMTLETFEDFKYSYKLADWEACKEEYHRLFPNSTKEPRYYVMSRVG